MKRVEYRVGLNSRLTRGFLGDREGAGELEVLVKSLYLMRVSHARYHIKKNGSGYTFRFALSIASPMIPLAQ